MYAALMQAHRLAENWLLDQLAALHLQEQAQQTLAA
jgi:hypothetical protein